MSQPPCSYILPDLFINQQHLLRKKSQCLLLKTIVYMSVIENITYISAMDSTGDESPAASESLTNDFETYILINQQ